MPIYRVGKPFPRPNPTPGAEGATALTNPDFFDVAFYSLHAEEDAERWETATVAPFLYVHEQALPFVVFLLVEAELSIEVTLNALAVPAEVLGPWLAATADAVSLFLVNAHTDLLTAHRLVPVGWAASLRRACQQQAAAYASAAEVQAALDAARQRHGLTAAEIIRRARNTANR